MIRPLFVFLALTATAGAQQLYIPDDTNSYADQCSERSFVPRIDACGNDVTTRRDLRDWDYSYRQESRDMQRELDREEGD